MTPDFQPHTLIFKKKLDEADPPVYLLIIMNAFATTVTTSSKPNARRVLAQNAFAQTAHHHAHHAFMMNHKMMPSAVDIV